MFTNAVNRTLCFLSFVFLCVSSTPTSTTVRPVSKKDACTFWQNFTKQMNDIHKTYSFIRYNCSYDNNQCNGAACTGSIRYQVLDMVEVNFCLGLRVNHCDSPVSLDMYYADPKSATKGFSARIVHNDRKELKNLKMDLGKFGVIEPFLFFNLTKPVPHHVLFGIKVKMRISSAFGTETWPVKFQQNVIPNTEIPVTPCQAKQNKTTKLQPKCSHTSMPVLTSTASPIIRSNTYFKPCAMYTFHSCNDNEVCRQNGTSSTGRCECETDHPFNILFGNCSGTGNPYTQGPFWTPTTNMPHVVSPGNSQPQTQKQSTTSNAALIGGVVAGVVLVAIVVIVVGVMCHRYRSNRQYIGRLLLNDDDNDNMI